MLVCVNYAPRRSQCYVRSPFAGLGDCRWRLTDLLGDANYDHDGNEFESRGLYLDLPPWGHHLFEVSAL